ncbi:hypothetical protein MED121_22127 [Marinomonas sp. MED121]|uniref:hypothetical protein n=1 Tax=Marinomonas sp. MED121 TaxID=314277 RepID=UPI000068FDB6|nr:hypothetical protein [Marinomonas sp. MED121]EAQ65415.1 hypothetical protein MED121_22127 [Marinomonas sp. MED121]
MRPFPVLKNYHGYLMFELAISLTVLMVLMQFLLPLVSHVRDQASTKERLLQRVRLTNAVMDHFQSQLAPIFFKGCGKGESLTIEIGSATGTLPDRISSKDLMAQSDWLVASHNGVCSYPMSFNTLSPTLAYVCDWDEGERVTFSSCYGEASGVINEVNTKDTLLHFSDGALLGESGILLSEQGFIWYVAQGMDAAAFWRTPSESGNSLELWSGISKLAVYPLLDTDQSGRLDQLKSDYGLYPLNQIKGVWLELMVIQANCDVNTSNNEAIYTSHRGEVWRYNPSCEFPLSFIVS